MRGVILLAFFALIGLALATFELESTSFSHSVCQPSYDPYDNEKYPCAQPSSKFWALLTVKNIGSTEWIGYTLQVSAECPPESTCFTSVDTDAPAIGAGQTGVVNASFVLPSIPGQYFPTLRFKSGASEIIAVTFGIEVTCSNGIFCDGIERWVKDSCVSSKSPCDDGLACTTDTCVESNRTCMRTVNDYEACDRCLSEFDGCIADCTGIVCGDDGCGGSCGDCGSGKVCGNSGTCTDYSLLTGTCLSPIKLFNNDEIIYGYSTVEGDTSTAVHVYQPKCNTASTAREQFYSFVVPAGKKVGVDIRSLGYDTVLELTKDECGDHSEEHFIRCSDDATPPSNLGSRVSALLTEGTYYLMVDGYSGVDFGPYTLQLRFADNCAPSCEGRFCGSDSCGGTCGDCGDNESCSGFNRCLANDCQPACNSTFVCGDDGCEGTCGVCNADAGELCVFDTRSCKYFPICDHLRPVCTGCTSTQYCGSDCVCYEADAAVPDLVINADKLRSEIIFESKTFDDASCAFYEKCVDALGERRLMRFTVEVINQGLAALVAPPPGTNPQLFQWSPCHGHFHFTQFAEYYLMSADGKVVRNGRKQAYCMLDSHQIHEAPDVPCKGPFSCTEQGVSAGWSDVYGNDLDCQWLDVTDVTPGDYKLYIAVNSERLFHEGSFENNEAVIDITLTAEQLAYTAPVAGPSKVSGSGILNVISIVILVVLVNML